MVHVVNSANPLQQTEKGFLSRCFQKLFQLVDAIKKAVVQFFQRIFPCIFGKQVPSSLTKPQSSASNSVTSSCAPPKAAPSPSVFEKQVPSSATKPQPSATNSMTSSCAPPTAAPSPTRSQGIPALDIGPVAKQEENAQEQAPDEFLGGISGRSRGGSSDASTVDEENLDKSFCHVPSDPRSPVVRGYQLPPPETPSDLDTTLIQDGDSSMFAATPIPAGKSRSSLSPKSFRDIVRGMGGPLTPQSHVKRDSITPYSAVEDDPTAKALMAKAKYMANMAESQAKRKILDSNESPSGWLVGVNAGVTAGNNHESDVKDSIDIDIDIDAESAKLDDEIIADMNSSNDGLKAQERRFGIWVSLEALELFAKDPDNVKPESLVEVFTGANQLYSDYFSSKKEAEEALSKEAVSEEEQAKQKELQAYLSSYQSRPLPEGVAEGAYTVTAEPRIAGEDFASLLAKLKRKVNSENPVVKALILGETESPQAYGLLIKWNQGEVPNFYLMDPYGNEQHKAASWEPLDYAGVIHYFDLVEEQLSILPLKDLPAVSQNH